jgi:hypothetical protein
VKTVAGPVQIPSVAVTETVAIIGVEPVLIAVKLGKFPVPEAAKPIEALLIFQLNVEEGVELVNTVVGTDSILQLIISETTSTIGNGQFDDVQVQVAGSIQEFPIGVRVIVTLSPALTPLLTSRVVVALDNVPVILTPAFIE